MNAHQVPVGALWLTNCVIQAFLLVTWFAEYAFTLALKMTSAMTLIPYLLRCGLRREAGVSRRDLRCRRTRPHVDGVRSAVATIYATGMIYAGGPKFLLLSAILYAPGTLLFFLAKRERKEAVFKPLEAVIFAAVTLAACAGIYALTVGAISI